jgi:hypothetical protein
MPNGIAGLGRGIERKFDHEFSARGACEFRMSVQGVRGVRGNGQKSERTDVRCHLKRGRYD